MKNHTTNYTFLRNSPSYLYAEGVIVTAKDIGKLVRSKLYRVEDVETKEEEVAPKEIDETMKTDPSEKPDNIVLRKLPRGPRYFDPPDNSWGNCYNCGEGGHTAVNCTSAKRKKPCFVCGSFEHNVKECNKGKDCFICKKSGHRAKDCPEKSNWASQNTKICLKCGGSGHEMFSCKNKYSPSDLKEIQCYICKCFGHLCCVNYIDEGPLEVSCYRCGQLGHSGWECARVHAETTSNGTPSSCYKCGEEGHMARKCTSSAKKDKNKSEFSSPRKRGINGNYVGARSVPPDFGNARKRNKTQYGESSSSEPKHKGKGGWITEDPGDYDNHVRGSPKTPARHKSKDRFHGGSGYKSNDRFHGGSGYKSNDRFHGGSGYDRFHGGSGYKSNNVFHGGNGYKSNDRFHGGGDSDSGFHSNGRQFQYGSPLVGSNGYQQRFSASRFGNSSSYGKREYGWDY
ncbi:zinc finger, CCHC-type [Artemisia annua]|uniref:Zinc finger, CCHC-type n=1 Tax=Artemisia annua TaxID=35608 RepID=A0A2U1KT89_ARTAN|nr:zinc finger, CCHC-type [Artemisia annua]